MLLYPIAQKPQHLNSTVPDFSASYSTVTVSPFSVFTQPSSAPAIWKACP
jgi:hypothetical protein